MPFDVITASIAGSHPKQRSPYQEAVDIQRRIYQATQADEVSGPTLATLARAWSEIEERKRVMKMKPAPKPVDVQPRGKAKQPRSSFTESAGPIVVPSVPKPAEPTSPDTTSKV